MAKILVNEFFRGASVSGDTAPSNEFVEFLVTETMTAAEFNRYVFGNFNSSLFFRYASYKFEGMELISPEFRPGTMITIGTSDRVTQDLTYNPNGGDWSISLHLNGKFLPFIGNERIGLGNSDIFWGGDVFPVYSPDAGDMGVYTGVGTPPPAHAQGVFLSLNTNNNSGSASNAPDNTQASNPANWNTNLASGNTTPTQPNPGNNTTNVNNIRGNNVTPFTLQLLHASDLEAGLPAIEDSIRFSAVMNALAPAYSNTLKLASGDQYIAGPFFNASLDLYKTNNVGRAGIADILINNALGWQAVAIGNHEFDDRPATFNNLIRPNANMTGPTLTNGYPGTAFPYLSTNLDFTNEVALNQLVVPQGQAPVPNSISKSVVIEVNGEKIGVVGATTPTLPQIASIGGIQVSPSNSSDLDALAAVIQPTVDALTAQGINKIILLAHMQQLDVEKGLATRLSNVDIIMAGGSHTLLAKSTDPLRQGDTRVDDYPLPFTSLSGQPTYVINTTSNYKYVGRFIADFDANGVITRVDGASGAYATDEAGVDRVYGSDVNPREKANQTIVQVSDAVSSITVPKDANVFGFTEVFLEGRREFVRTEETNLGNLMSDAHLFTAKFYDPTTVVSIKNGGGIRDYIGQVLVPDLLPPAAVPGVKEAGQISQLDIENSLRFNNDLSLVTVSATELKQILEYGVAASAPGATPGQFPQIGGLSFSYDLSKTAISFTRDANQVATGVAVDGQRILNAAILDENGAVSQVLVSNGQVVGDPNRSIRLVTGTFTANGGDGYPFPLFKENQLDLTGQPIPNGAPNRATFTNPSSEQDSVAEYLAEVYPANKSNPYNIADTAKALDTRIQDVAVRQDTVLTGVFIGTGDQTFEAKLTPTGFTGDRNSVFAGAGNNLIDVTQGVGSNVLRGEGGDDQILVSTKDKAYGDDGNDILDANGGKGMNTLFGGAGNDQIFLKQSDLGYGGDGNDELFSGSGGGNTLDGEGGNDMLYAGQNDMLLGGDGDDMLFVGSSGGHQLTGGTGSDQFWVVTGGTMAPTVSVITDFDGALDKIGIGGVAGASFTNLSFLQQGNDTSVSLNNVGIATLLGIQANNLTANQFVFQS